MAGYGDDSGFTAWLATNGYSLPEGAPAEAVLRQRGSAYVDAVYGPRFPGVPTAGLAQDRAWPRTGATAYGAAIADDLIPTPVVDASYFAAYQEATSPGSLSVITSTAAAVRREKVGALEVEYFQGQDSALTNATPMILAVDGLLAPLLLGEAPKVGLGLWSL